MALFAALSPSISPVMHYPLLKSGLWVLGMLPGSVRAFYNDARRPQLITPSSVASFFTFAAAFLNVFIKSQAQLGLSIISQSKKKIEHESYKRSVSCSFNWFYCSSDLLLLLSQLTQCHERIARRISECQQFNVSNAYAYFSYSQALLQSALESTTSLIIVILEHTLHRRQSLYHSHHYSEYLKITFFHLRQKLLLTINSEAVIASRAGNEKRWTVRCPPKQQI